MNNASTISSDAKLCLGEILISPNAASRLENRDIEHALERHEAGDYGLVTDECVKHNEIAALNGFAIRSAYRGKEGLLFLVVTDGERASTCVLMPHEWNRFVAAQKPGDVVADAVPEVPLGEIVGTPGASESVSPDEAAEALNRHMHGDWGDVSPDDWKSNDAALVEGDRLLSSYRTESGVKFWVITEADRSSTTILLPEEY